MKIPPHMRQPTTPIRGLAARPFLYGDKEVRGVMKAANRAHARETGNWRKTAIKWKRASRGFLLDGLAYYWTVKGYYRCGHGDRRPLQHLLWEQRTGQRVPRGHEIWFKDRDRHNFSPANLECLPKSVIHDRIWQRGECTAPTPEQRRQAWDTRVRNKATASRSQTALLLQRFEQKKNHEHTNIEPVRSLVASRDADRRAKNARYNAGWYRRRKAAGWVRPSRRAAPHTR